MESDMPRTAALPAVDVPLRLRASNRRIAWTLASIAALFFAGIIATRWVGGRVGIGVMGTAVLLFLVIAIGRNLRTARSGEGAEPNAGSARAARADDAQHPDAPGDASEPLR
jgi:hypothetical protein